MPTAKRHDAKSRCNIRCECGGHTRVIDSRRYKDGNNTRRRRECQKCGMCFTTIEMTVDEYNEFVAAWNQLDEIKQDIASYLRA